MEHTEVLIVGAGASGGVAAG
ncbi:MAG: hypothetical protein QOG96_781, partial [Pseudonocardiales bacterium]|nr:hypothetical protein [Pseudonocardiales bacterium]